jgi:hypothetical protein
MEGKTIVFADQSGFYLLPMVVRTYAPVGKTPILKENLTRDRLSAILASGAAARLQLEQLPGYAPDLNPDEGVWKHLKCGIEEPLLPEPLRVEG